MSLIRCLLREECRIWPYIREGAGESIYGEMEERPCRFEPGLHLKQDLPGVNGTLLEVPGVGVLFLEGNEVPVRSRVALGDREYEVQACRVCRAFGDHHLELELK